MMSVFNAVKNGVKERVLAQAVLSEYFKEKQVAYPINPFQMLTDYGIPFVFEPFRIRALKECIFPHKIILIFLLLG